MHLARLAKYLRLLGFDTVYSDNIGDDELIGRCRFGRIGLTCDRRLQERAPDLVILLKCEDATIQAKRVVKMLNLTCYAHPFRRSLCCNKALYAVSKRDNFAKIPKETYRWLNGYWRCSKCGNLYWQGTHAKRMRKKVYEILGF